MPDAVIIGAGYAGMSAAALLSHAGRKVVVLEESERVGGRARSFRDEEGYLREYGAHSHRLAHKGIANEVFKRLGEEIDFLPESKDGKLIFRGRLWERPEGPIGFLKTPLLSIRARLVLLALFAKIKKTDPADWYHRTLLDFYRASFRNPEVEAFLPFLGMTIMCPDPNKVSAGEVIDFLKRVLAAGVGVGEPRGGSAGIFQTLSRHIDRGGEIHLRERAEKIIIENRRVTGVKTGRAIYPAPVVLFAAGLPLIADLLDQTLLPAAVEKYAKNIEHSSGLVIDFITNRPITGIRSEAEQKMKSVISAVFPDFLPAVVDERKMVATVMNGNVLTPAQSKPNRPDVECPGIEGLYFIGDTVRGDGCSGDISFSSAMKAADKILSDRKP